MFRVRKGNKNKNKNGNKNYPQPPARRGGNLNVQGGGMSVTISPPQYKGKVMQPPGSKEVAYSGTGVQAPEGGGKWGAAVFDPAHTRAIGCVGIPDTNQNPTSIPSGRKELTFSPTNITKPHWIMCADFTGYPEYFATTSYSNEWTFYQHPVVGFLAYNPDATFVYKKNSTDTSTTTVSHKATWFGWNVLAKQDDPNEVRQINTYDERTISAGFTVKPIGKWADMGGYYTGGHVPLEESDDVDAANDQQDGLVLPYVEDLTNYVTYQAGSAEGAYAVCRPRHMPSLLEFAPTRTKPIYLPNGAGTVLSSCSQQGKCNGWDAAFVCYKGASDGYQLTVTAYHTKERLLPYQDGGTDGAVYDKVALEAVPAACDKMICIYPASYNDLGKLKPYLFNAFRRLGRVVRNTLGIDAAVLEGPTFKRRFFREIMNELGRL